MSEKEGENNEQREIHGVWPGSCFGCSATNPHGLQLKFSHAELGCVARCTVPETMCGFDGIVHGGIIATILDEAAAWALFAYLGRYGVTREMTTRYLKAAPTGRELFVEGRVTGHDGRKAEIASFLHLADGTLLAEASSKWVLLSDSRIAALTGVEEETLARFMADCRK